MRPLQVRVAAASEQMARLFRHSYIFQLYQPTYASGHYSFMLASDEVRPPRPSTRAFPHFPCTLPLYTSLVHFPLYTSLAHAPR